MKTLGIIAEYNPFHNGHLYQLEKAKEITGAASTICVLSSNFVQRGEPALLNKWVRTKAALLSGIDLVIELPALYSISSSEYFAFSSVKILNDLNIVDYLCFGSEDGKLDYLDKISKILSHEEPLFKSSLKTHLSKGDSYPKAREKAILENNPDIPPHFLKGSNNILGVEYLKALQKLNSTIEPITIKRISNAYNQKDLTGKISSATSIRSHIHSPDIKETMPKSSYDLLEEEILKGRSPNLIKDYETLILGILRINSKDQLKNLPYMEEGLHNRLYHASQKSGNLEELFRNLNTKRYPQTRMNRILMNALVGITKNDLVWVTQSGGAPYARILGFTKKGEHLLSQITKTATIPIITNLKEAKNASNPILQRVAQIEERATNLYVLGYKNTDFKKAGIDFTHTLVKL
jgi:predicted nucleotidyltransferase